MLFIAVRKRFSEISRCTSALNADEKNTASAQAAARRERVLRA